VAGFVALACAAILTLSGWREWETRRVDLKNAEVDMANLARSLTQHADDTFELADTVLIGLVNRLETDGTEPAAIERVQAFMQLRKSTAKRIRSIFVYDETGRGLATTEHIDLTGLNDSDRDYFQRHQTSRDRGTLIGRPVISRPGGQWIITASRRFNHLDGSFAGLVLVTIDVAYFSEYYSQFDVGANGAISLLSADGIILARSGDDGSNIGRDMSQSPLFRDLRERPAASVYYFKSPLDGRQRLSFYKLSDRYPVLVLATEAQDDVLATWRQETLTHMALVLSLTALIAIIGFYLVRQMLERQRVAAVLLAKEADFRLLAEQSSDMVMRIGLDERILYVSPACARVLGWTPEQLTGSSALAGVHPEDLPRVQQGVAALKSAALKSGKAEETRITHRARHREKGEIWIETNLRVIRGSETAEIVGVVGVSRDVTKQKDLEEKLAALATCDGLTNLANRRHFDEQLKEEWARAKRDSTALSLLMIDVDHFKQFNDLYGHQAGDSCLRSVARVLAERARRPADLAVRYGGEEFALLLPNTDADACNQIGERVRESIHELAILHALNPPAKCVTVSLGGATISPAVVSADCGSLVKAADQALYRAKDNGRDQMIIAGQIVSWPGAKSA